MTIPEMANMSTATAGGVVTFDEHGIAIVGQGVADSLRAVYPMAEIVPIDTSDLPQPTKTTPVPVGADSRFGAAQPPALSEEEEDLIAAREEVALIAGRDVRDGGLTMRGTPAIEAPPGTATTADGKYVLPPNFVTGLLDAQTPSVAPSSDIGGLMPPTTGLSAEGAAKVAEEFDMEKDHQIDQENPMGPDANPAAASPDAERGAGLEYDSLRSAGAIAPGPTVPGNMTPAIAQAPGTAKAASPSPTAGEEKSAKTEAKPAAKTTKK